MGGEFAAWVGGIGLVLAILTFFLGRISASRKEGETTGALASDVAHIKETTDRLETRFHDDLQQTNGRLDEQTRNANAANVLAATALDCAKSAHHRISEHLQREHDMSPVKDNFRDN